MTHIYSLRALFLAFALAAAALATVAVQYAISFFVSGMHDSASLRVSVNNACSNDAHFTGCSSIL